MLNWVTARNDGPIDHKIFTAGCQQASRRLGLKPRAVALDVRMWAPRWGNFYLPIVRWELRTGVGYQRDCPKDEPPQLPSK